MTNWLAVDFGTSNTAVAYMNEGVLTQIILEQDSVTIPTAVFFPQGQGIMNIGAAANNALIQGDEGRYMRALKSILGTSLMSEQRLLGGRRLDLYKVITSFLEAVKQRSEELTGKSFDHVLSGRPVRFHSKDAEMDAQSALDLEQCYRNAGFKSVKFCPEPEAAAISLGGQIPNGRYGLVVDIGGGTSDFTLFKAGDEIEVLQSFGVRIGGTDFDRVLSYMQIMPYFGRGHRLRRQMSDDTLVAPNHLFHDLSRWEKIAFVYDPATLKLARELKRDAVNPNVFARLIEVLEYQYGHELAFRVEDAKIACNKRLAAHTAELGFLSEPLAITVSYEKFLEDVADLKAELQFAMRATLHQAGVDPLDVQDIVFVGGSSLMGFVKDAITQVFGAPRIHQDAIFTAIVDGLAMQSAKYA